MKQRQIKNHVQERMINKAVAANLKKYKKTYQLLVKYDQSPEAAPNFKIERQAMRKTLQQVSI